MNHNLGMRLLGAGPEHYMSPHSRIPPGHNSETPNSEGEIVMQPTPLP